MPKKPLQLAAKVCLERPKAAPFRKISNRFKRSPRTCAWGSCSPSPSSEPSSHTSAPASGLAGSSASSWAAGPTARTSCPCIASSPPPSASCCRPSGCRRWTFAPPTIGPKHLGCCASGLDLGQLRSGSARNLRRSRLLRLPAHLGHSQLCQLGLHVIQLLHKSNCRSHVPSFKSSVEVLARNW